jgi:hypothetical protein
MSRKGRFGRLSNAEMENKLSHKDAVNTKRATQLAIQIPHGKNTLGNMLKTICKQSGLNYIYTNHSLRATSITVLDFNKFEARNIMAVIPNKLLKQNFENSHS